ncbi:carboxymuconolactone decarboxylase family protein [Reyranella sp. CPCC 100927]|uniref:carboxymuconolactone decarboxylase family protein n=1 Tax=Reyranella sp. CPCC 100927 TaxID=2599616 RepID=UPI0011B4BAB7|nr:carboxymuconolactone decarboxylase family protein [Reyranella sp. CPCC 100927]TWT15655.1 carboxymuconolactone decarboxylase family protein [Reyranella sp. CPCC 100927]
MADPRIAPLEPPYPAEAQAAFDRIMPPDMTPLVLFRTLATCPRIWEKFRAGSLLDKGPVPLRLREIVIDRVCARCGNAYEWGVHVAIFAERVELTAEQQRATVRDGADAACWAEDERAAIRLADELHDTAAISDGLWTTLRVHFSDAQILELIALCGFYRTVSYFCTGLRLPQEPWAARFPD